MRLAELSRRSGVPRSTIKFYIREGMLPPGKSVGRNQALYGPEHLERLALIGALREVAELPLEVIARVTSQLDRGWNDGDPIGEALLAIHGPRKRRRTPEEKSELEQLRTEVRELMRGLPWTTDDERHYFGDEIAETLLDVRRYLYPGYPVAALLPLARVAWRLSQVEFEHAPGGPRVPLRARGDDLAEPTRRAILGSVLFERIFAALHRSANSMRSILISEERPVPPVEDETLPGDDRAGRVAR
ncbi:MAG TPA: MerR family transcriptional regulator [Myxococcota bacterium]|nr:MerR family transcriptional regulator [Myxococcota bacterium]